MIMLSYIILQWPRTRTAFVKWRLWMRKLTKVLNIDPWSWSQRSGSRPANLLRISSGTTTSSHGGNFGEEPQNTIHRLSEASIFSLNHATHTTVDSNYFSLFFYIIIYRYLSTVNRTEYYRRDNRSWLRQKKCLEGSLQLSKKRKKKKNHKFALNVLPSHERPASFCHAWVVSEHKDKGANLIAPTTFMFLIEHSLTLTQSSLPWWKSDSGCLGPRYSFPPFPPTDVSDINEILRIQVYRSTVISTAGPHLGPCQL